MSLAPPRVDVGDYVAHCCGAIELNLHDRSVAEIDGEIILTSSGGRHTVAVVELAERRVVGDRLMSFRRVFEATLWAIPDRRRRSAVESCTLRLLVVFPLVSVRQSIVADAGVNADAEVLLIWFTTSSSVMSLEVSMTRSYRRGR